MEITDQMTLALTVRLVLESDDEMAASKIAVLLVHAEQTIG